MNIYTTIDSPLGELLLVGEQTATGTTLTRLTFDPGEQPRTPEPFADIERELREYFAGERTTFGFTWRSNGTAFQERVWAAVEAVPYGRTATYGEIAERIGAPRDRIRAVGAAIGANPLLIVRPCHRVIGATGSLTGYAGAVERKRDLLTLEGALQPQLP